MNWKIILLLTALGTAIAVASTFGIINSNYFLDVYMIIFAIVSGIVIYRTCNSSLFMHGVMVGLLSGIFGSWFQATWFNSYLSHNPHTLDGFKNITGDLQPMYVLLFAGPFFGICYGIIAGLTALLLNKISKKSNN